MGDRCKHWFPAHAILAQLVERRICNAQVGGSSPLGSSIKQKEGAHVIFQIIQRSLDGACTACREPAYGHAGNK